MARSAVGVSGCAASEARIEYDEAVSDDAWRLDWPAVRTAGVTTPQRACT
jgi:hypothetical protein